MPEPDILFGNEATSALARGFDRICELAARTLGPAQGLVFSQAATSGAPEALTDAATVARRIFELPDRAENVGAMLARSLIWRMQSRTGDGSAMAAVLAQELLRSGFRYAAAGGNVLEFRTGVGRAVAAATESLRASVRPVLGRDNLRRLAESVTGEPEMSLHLAEIFEEIGPEAYVRIERFAAPYLAHEFQAGAQWSGILVSPYFITDQAAQTARLAACAVALFDGDVAAPEQIGPLLELSQGSADRGLLLVANEISGRALATLVANHQPDGRRIVAVQLMRPGTQRDTDYQDLSVFTGAALLSPKTGRSLEGITQRDLGQATGAVAGKEHLVVMCGEERAGALAGQVQAIRDRLAALADGDDSRGELQMRGARLSGQTATLKIGAHTESQRAYLQARAEKALRTLPLAMQRGVLPGGGAAYVHCLPAAAAASGPAEAAGYEAARRALAAPFLRIATNAGVRAPAVALDEVQRHGAPYGYDALTHSVRDMMEAGIVDPVDVLVAALEIAASGSMLALTAGAIVLRRNPETTFEP